MSERLAFNIFLGLTLVAHALGKAEIDCRGAFVRNYKDNSIYDWDRCYMSNQEHAWNEWIGKFDGCDVCLRFLSNFGICDLCVCVGGHTTKFDSS